MENQKFLVTGGLGFIGTNFIRYILDKYPQIEIINLDKVTYAGNPENLEDLESNKNYRFVKGDICDEKIVSELIEGCDSLFNFAAESHVDRSIRSPKIFFETNILGTYNLIECARKEKIKRFVQISTDEVYGSLNDGSFTENSVLNPSSPYSSSKAGAEMLVNAYHTTYGMDTIITRSSNNFGPYQYPEKFIPLSITNLLEGGKIPVYGKGLNVRDWIYVQDNCEAIYQVHNKGKSGQIYNIGGGNEIKNIDIARLILKTLNKDEEYMEFVSDRLGHDFRYSITCNKITEIGWKPRFNFNQALEKTINWYKDNEKWWKKIKNKQK